LRQPRQSLRLSVSLAIDVVKNTEVLVDLLEYGASTYRCSYLQL
jgi:hypothetical protein